MTWNPLHFKEIAAAALWRSREGQANASDREDRAAVTGGMSCTENAILEEAFLEQRVSARLAVDSFFGHQDNCQDMERTCKSSRNKNADEAHFQLSVDSIRV